MRSWTAGLQSGGSCVILSGMETEKNTKNSALQFKPEQFGNRLKQARLELRLNTLQASEIIGVEKNSYYKYEDGSRFPKPEILLAIMVNFNLNINYLLSGEGEMFIRKGEQASELKQLFPDLSRETYPLIEDMQVPVMKHSIMTHYLVEKEKFRSFIDSYFEEKQKKFSTRKKETEK